MVINTFPDTKKKKKTVPNGALIEANCVKVVLGLVADGCAEDLQVAEGIVRILWLVLAEKREAMKKAATSVEELKRLAGAVALALEKGNLNSKADAAKILEVFVAEEDDGELGFPTLCFGRIAEREASLSRLFGLCARREIPERLRHRSIR
ncbi:hypothetical protein ACLOJK_021636 [Asimina triloba]